MAYQADQLAKAIKNIGENEMKNPYPIRIFFDPRDKTWIAISDDLPGCSAGRDTPPETLAEFEISVDAWLEARKKTGLEITEPSMKLVSP